AGTPLRGPIFQRRWLWVPACAGTTADEPVNRIRHDMTPGGAPLAFEDPDRGGRPIIERAGKNIEVALPLGPGKANHVANALFKRAAADPSIKLRIFTALALEKPRSKSDLERRFLEPVVDRVFAGYPELAYALALHAGTLPPNVKVDEFFF